MPLRAPVAKEFFPLVRNGDVHALHLLLHSERNWLGKELLAQRDGFNNTGLIAAASHGNSAMVSYLLTHADDKDGLNATNFDKPETTETTWRAVSGTPWRKSRLCLSGSSIDYDGRS